VSPLLEPTPARMPPRRKEWPVKPLVYERGLYNDHEWELRAAVAYRKMMIEERGASWLTAEPVLRSVIWLRDGGRCRYCGRLVELRRTGDIPPEDRMTFDHVVPISRGGEHTYANIWASCHECNTLKGGMTLPEFDAWLLNELA
jgi:5-methylcytosine-specific restriction endonuclease McrA